MSSPSSTVRVKLLKLNVSNDFGPVTKRIVQSSFKDQSLSDEDGTCIQTDQQQYKAISPLSITSINAFSELMP